MKGLGPQLHFAPCKAQDRSGLWLESRLLSSARQVRDRFPWMQGATPCELCIQNSSVHPVASEPAGTLLAGWRDCANNHVVIINSVLLLLLLNYCYYYYYYCYYYNHTYYAVLLLLSLYILLLLLLFRNNNNYYYYYYYHVIMSDGFVWTSEPTVNKDMLWLEEGEDTRPQIIVPGGHFSPT
jgi:hypothetical protein